MDWTEFKEFSGNKVKVPRRLSTPLVIKVQLRTPNRRILKCFEETCPITPKQTWQNDVLVKPRIVTRRLVNRMCTTKAIKMKTGYSQREYRSSRLSGCAEFLNEDAVWIEYSKCAPFQKSCDASRERNVDDILSKWILIICVPK